jgi:Dienelactone hydrolase family
MVVATEYADIALPGSPMRTFVSAPKAEGEYPGIWCYSDIFQLTQPLLRTCVRLAGYGFVAAAPEIYRRIEPPGTVIPFDDAGRTAASKTLQKLRSRISMPIAALAWTGFPNIRKSRQGKSVSWVSASAGTSRFERRSSPMSAQRSATTARASMMASSVRTPMPDRWPAQEKSAVNF